MIEKNIPGISIPRHDIEANWDKLVNFIPEQGEPIVYDIDDNNSKARIKLGDGVHIPKDLPFVTPIRTSELINDGDDGSNAYPYTNLQAVSEYVNERVTQEIKSLPDESGNDYATYLLPSSSAVMDYVDKTDKIANSVLDFNAKKSGNIISLTDVDPKPHKLLVKLTSDTVTDFSTVRVFQTGRNLLGSFVEETQTVTESGVSFEIRSNNTIKTWGTATADIALSLYNIYLPAGTYTLQGALTRIPEGVTIGLLGTELNLGSSMSSVTATLSEDGYYQFAIQIDNGTVVAETSASSVACYIGNLQIAPGSVVTSVDESTYVKEFQSSADGVILDIDSSSPEMTLYTDNPEVIINVAYRQDEWFKYGLPVLELNGDTSAMTKDNKVTLDYKYDDKNISGTCTLKWQGASSIRYPKKNFTINFDNKFEAVEGWGEQKKYCLKANYMEHSHARNLVCAKLWGQIVSSRKNIDEGLQNAPNFGAVDGFPIVIKLNNEFQGLYTFNIPKDEWTFGMSGDSETKQGFVCADLRSAATGFSGEAEVIAEKDFELEFNSDNFSEDELKNSLNNLINTCINIDTNSGLYVYEDGTKVEGMSYLEQFVDMESAIDYLIFTAMVGGQDMDKKNYILATYNGTKWIFSAYDMDTTFGVTWDGGAWFSGQENTIMISDYASSHKLMKLIKKYKYQALVDRYNQLKNSVLSYNNVSNIFENFAAAIPSALYEEDVKRWSEIPGTEVNEVRQILTWYKDRMQLIENEFNTPVLDAPLTTDYIVNETAYLYPDAMVRTTDSDWYRKYDFYQFGQFNKNGNIKLNKPIIDINIDEIQKNSSNAFFLQKRDSDTPIRVNSKLSVHEPLSHKESLSIVDGQTIESQNGISCEIIDSQTIKLHCDSSINAATTFLVELDTSNILKNETYDIVTEVLEGTLPGALTINISNASGKKVHGGNGSINASVGRTAQLTFGTMEPSHLKIVTQSAGTIDNLVFKISLKLVTKNVLVVGDSITASPKNWLQKVCENHFDNITGYRFIGSKVFASTNALYMNTTQEVAENANTTCEIIDAQTIRLNSSVSSDTAISPEFFIELDSTKFKKNTTYTMNTQVVSGTVNGSLNFVLTSEIGGSKVNGGYGTVANSQGSSKELTLGNNIPKYLKISSASTVGNLKNLVITMTLSAEDTNKKYEATRGYTWDNYTKNPINLPSNYPTNPFWTEGNHIEGDSLINPNDISSYVTNMAGSDAVLDYVVCMLGMNSYTYVNHAFNDGDMDNILGSIRVLATHFIDTVLTAYPKCKILLASYAMPPFIDGINDAYWNTLVPRADFIHRLNELYQDLATTYNSKIRFVHITSQVDAQNAYPISTQNINGVEYTFIDDDVQVHVNDIGQYQISEAMWRGFNGLVNM